jgi:TctA family transporter
MSGDFVGGALSALELLIAGPHLMYLMIGVLMGLIVGFLPGLGGISGLALILPFIFEMDPGSALAMMIGLVAVTPTGDTFTAILIGIPGSAGGTATTLDGFPLAKQGQAARALAASFTASLFGGIFGALCLTVAFIFARPLLMAIGFPEQLMLIILALSLLGMLTGRSMVKGLASAAIGLLLGTIGAATATAEYRMTGGTIYLSDGLPLVLIALGIFAVPEIIDVLRRHYTISTETQLGSGWKQGFMDVVHNRWLVLRCSGLGALLGAMPGISGAVIDWIAYGHVVQSSRDKSMFGKGDIRGVIAPESANNAKEGGSLIPTLLLGIPHSASTALLLGGLVVIGITPGRDMVTKHIDMTYLIVWSLAVANIVGAGICLLLAKPIARITTVPFFFVAPFMVVLLFFAAFQSSSSWGDLIAMFMLGVLGLFMKRFGWSRPAMLIGFVLSKPLEAAYYRTVQIYGPELFLRPVTIGIIVIIAVSAFFVWRSKATVHEDDAATEASANYRGPQIAFAALLFAFPVYAIFDTYDLRYLSKVFPISLALIAGAFALTALCLLMSKRTGTFLQDAEAEMAARGEVYTSNVYYLAWMAGPILLSALVGFFLGASAYVFFFLRYLAKASVVFSVIGAAATAFVLWALGYTLSLLYPPGLLQKIADLPGVLH